MFVRPTPSNTHGSHVTRPGMLEVDTEAKQIQRQCFGHAGGKRLVFSYHSEACVSAAWQVKTRQDEAHHFHIHRPAGLRAVRLNCFDMKVTHRITITADGNRPSHPITITVVTAVIRDVATLGGLHRRSPLNWASFSFHWQASGS